MSIEAVENITISLVNSVPTDASDKAAPVPGDSRPVPRRRSRRTGDGEDAAVVAVAVVTPVGGGGQHPVVGRHPVADEARVLVVLVVAKVAVVILVVGVAVPVLGYD